MNWEPDFSDFLLNNVVAAMSPTRVFLLGITAVIIAAFFKSTNGRAFILKVKPWKQKTLQFKDLLIKDLGFKYTSPLSNFDGTHILQGSVSGQDVRVEITAGSRGFFLFEGFTVTTVIKLNGASSEIPNIFPKRLDEFTSIRGNEVTRLTYMEKPDLSLFKAEVQTAIRLSPKSSYSRIAA